MDVTMRLLLLSRRTDINHSHLEGEVLARELMVHIEGRALFTNRGDRERDHVAVWRLCRELSAHLKPIRKLGEGDLLNRLWVTLAISVFWAEIKLDLIPS
jgi:hypothetical protein